MIYTDCTCLTDIMLVRNIPTPRTSSSSKSTSTASPKFMNYTGASRRLLSVLRSSHKRNQSRTLITSSSSPPQGRTPAAQALRRALRARPGDISQLRLPNPLYQRSCTPVPKIASTKPAHPDRAPATHPMLLIIVHVAHCALHWCTLVLARQ